MSAAIFSRASSLIRLGTTPPVWAGRKKSIHRSKCSPIRAAALGRAAANVLERAQLGVPLRRALGGAAEALCAAGRPELGMGYAKRMRESAQADEDALDEASAILIASKQLFREGELDKALALCRRASALLEEHGDLLQAAEGRLFAPPRRQGGGRARRGT